MSAFLVAAFFASALAVTGGPLHASAQTGSGLADAVPSGSVLYMEVQLDQSSDQWTKTYALLDRAGLSDLAEDELSQSPEELGQMAEMFNLTGNAALVFTSAEGLTSGAMDDFANDATGMTVDPASAISSSDVPEGFVVVIQPDDPEALYGQFQAMVAEEASDAGTTVETTTYNGVDIEYWTAVDEWEEPTAIALVGDTVALSTRPADIEPVIDTVAGDLQPLSSDEGFSSVQQALAMDALSFGYMNGTAFADQLAMDDPEFSELAGDIDAHIGWSAYADDAGFRLDTVTIPVAGGALPVASAFTPTFASKFPADALYFVNGNDLSATGLTDAVGLILQMALSEESTTSSTPSAATPTIDEAFDEAAAMLGFNPKTDLLDQLNGEFGMYADASNVFSGQPVIDVAFVSDVADAQTVEDATTQISFLASSIAGEDVTVTERQVPGGAVTSIPLSSEDTGDIALTLEYGVVDGQLLIGLNNGIDSYLDGSTTRLADDPVYEQTMSVLPQDNIVGVQFLNLQRLMPLIEEAATSLSSSMDVVDADEACADYATQEEAQAAYDEDPIGLWNLDLNFNGDACEDFFNAGDTPEASPESATESLNLLAVGTVAHTDGDIYRTSTVLLIGE